MDTVSAHLREAHAPAVAHTGDADLRGAVAEGIARARAQGLSAANEIAFFVALQFEVGPRFDEHPLVEEILHTTGLSPDERMDLLARLPPEVWQAAGRDPASA